MAESQFFELQELELIEEKKDVKKKNEEEEECRCPSPTCSRANKIFFGSLFAVALIILSIFIGMISFTERVTTWCLFSYLPYLFIGGCIFVFGPPFPFKSPNEELFSIFYGEEDPLKEVYQFSLGALSSAPIAVTIIIAVTLNQNFLIFLIFLSHIMIFVSSILYLRIFFTPAGSNELIDEEEEEFY